MSAFECSANHINQMVAYAKTNELYGNRQFPKVTNDNAMECTTFLHTANMRSLEARYPNHHPHQEEHFMKFSDRRSQLTMVEFLKLVDCFEYQSCEVEDFDSTDCAKLLNNWRKGCISKLAGYDAAPWGI